MNFHNQNIERGVISSIIFDPLIFDEVKNSLSEDSFYLPFHKTLYQAFVELDKEGKPIDEEFIKDYLQKNKAWREDDFLDVLATSPLSNLEAYIKELNELKNRRELYLFTRDIQEKIKQGESLDEVIPLVSQIEQFESGFTLQGESLDQIEDIPPEFILEDFLPIPRATVSMISAPGGTGKSWLVLQLAIRYALSHPNKKIFLWLSEDKNSISKNRAISINQKVLNNTTALPKNIILYDKAPPILYNRKTLTVNHNFYKIKSALKGYDWVVFDPLLAFYGGDENSNGEARSFMQPFMNWASEADIPITFLHHSTKPDDSGFSRSRGASAFLDAVRVAYEMSKITYKEGNKVKQVESELHNREIVLTKDNYGAMKYLPSFIVKKQITPLLKGKEVKIVYKDDRLELPPI